MMGLQHADFTLFPIFFYDFQDIRLNKMKENSFIELALNSVCENFCNLVDNSI